ncbi:MAG TPA: hypothetical protein ENG21_01000 [Nitrososphaeria archaeon]|nr:hypothetical protein [Nitrososphaeria archaeon]
MVAVMINEKHYFFRVSSLMPNQKSKEIAYPSEKTEDRGELRRKMGVGSALPASRFSLERLPHPLQVNSLFMIYIFSWGLLSTISGTRLIFVLAE